LGEGDLARFTGRSNRSSNVKSPSKVILPQFANQPDFIRNFETEAQLIAQLEHIHIVPLYDYWRDPSGAFLVMRMLRGGSLESVLKDCQPQPLDLVVRWVEQITSALSVAHQSNVVQPRYKTGEHSVR